MKVLVGYASEHGSTRGIGERIAQRLAARGIAAEARPLSTALDPAPYRAYVLGSAIHSGNWLPAGGEFLRRHRSALARCPVWLFSVSTVGETSSAFPPRVAARMRQVLRLPAAVATVADAVRPREHHRFAGVVLAEHWGMAGRVFMTGMGGRYGDHRDWADIDAWAEDIAAGLGVPAGGSGSADVRPLA